MRPVITLAFLLLTSVTAASQSVNVIFHYRASDTSPNIGFQMAALGDINLDGFDDFATAGAPPLQSLIFLGGAPADSAPAFVLRGSINESSIRDMDGDGIADVVTSVPSSPGLLMCRGTGTGFLTYPTDSLLNSSGVNFGTWFRVGLVDTGRIGDVLVSDHDYPPGGRVELYLNPFLAADTSIWSWNNTDVQRQIFGGGLIDFNGDGQVDIFIAVQGAEGFVFIFFGPNFGQLPNLTIPQPPGFPFPPRDFPRLAKAIGDFNGDGFQDLGVLFNSKPIVYFGGPTADSMPDVVLSGSGYAFSSVGDINDDGFDDVATGDGRVLGGVVDLYFGGILTDSVWDFSVFGNDLPPIGLDRIGEVVAGAGDFDGDGHNDILVKCDRYISGQPQDIFVVAGGRGIITDIAQLPQESASEVIELSVGYPNPFNLNTTLTISNAVPVSISLTIYNIAGQLVKVLARGQQAAGSHAFDWDGSNDEGIIQSSGVYFCRMSVEDLHFEQTQKIVLIK